MPMKTVALRATRHLLLGTVLRGAAPSHLTPDVIGGRPCSPHLMPRHRRQHRCGVLLAVERLGHPPLITQLEAIVHSQGFTLKDLGEWIHVYVHEAQSDTHVRNIMKALGTNYVCAENGEGLLATRLVELHHFLVLLHLAFERAKLSGELPANACSRLYAEVFGFNLPRDIRREVLQLGNGAAQSDALPTLEFMLEAFGPPMSVQA